MTKDGASRELLESHRVASAWFEAQLAVNTGRVHRIPDVLSVANRHLGSQTTLMHRQPDLAVEVLRRKYRRYRRRYRKALPAELEWCRPEFEAMDALMSDIRLR